jgi:alkanesulfonate monooxygenase SsuD/methylene tetrahydromethanopterin reductase-like flavin-dependent oxidoreductase (luciferase family)
MRQRARFGFYIDFSLHALSGASIRAWWLELEALCRELEGLGFDFIWLGEHHFGEAGFTSNPLLSLAALARVTEEIRLGTYVLLLPFHHPLRIAEDAATVDILSGGRLDLGFGLGYRQIEFDGFEIDRAQRVGRLEEGIEIIRRAFTGEPVDFAGRHFRVPGVKVTPTPLSRPAPPLWLAARSEKAARRAGRLGLNLLLHGGGTILRAWEEELVGHGHDPAAMMVTGYRPFFVSRDPVGDLARLDEEFKYFGRVQGGWMAADKETSFDSVIARTWSEDPIKGMKYLVGTPDEVLEELMAYYLRKPFTHYVAPIPPPYDLGAVRSSVKLFAAEVIPAFRSWQAQEAGGLR